MRRLVLALLALCAGILFAAPAAQATEAQACYAMATSTAVGQSDNTDANGNHYAAPINQATYIAVSQGSSNYFTLVFSTVKSSGYNPVDCESRYEYNDTFGVYRLIKIRSLATYFGGTVSNWTQQSRNCWFRTSPSNSWTPWSC